MSLLDTLDFGQDSAESEADALRFIFWSTPFYKRLRTLKKWLMLGRKGAGKTASCMMLFRQLQGDSRVTLLTPRSLSAAKSAVLDKTSINSGEAALLKWKYVFLIEAIRNIIDATEKKLGTNHAAWPEPIRKVRAFLVEQDIKEANQFEKAMKIIRSISKFAVSVAKVEGSLEIDSKTNSTDTLGDELDLIFSLVQESAELVMQQPLYILVDKVDELWDSTELGRDLVIGLLRAAKETNDLIGSMKVIVFLRSDIFSYLRFHDSDKYRSHTELIVWDKNNLKRLIVLRIQRSTGIRGDVDSIWEAVFPSQLDGKDSFEFLMNFTLMRPRDLIQLCNRCRDLASNRGGAKIIEQDVKDALPEYSKWQLEDLISEYSFQYPFLERLLLSVFYCHPTPYLERRDFETLFEPHKSDFVAEFGIGYFESIDALLQILYMIGFLGVLHNGRILYESLGDKFILPYATNLVVHPAFRNGLNIPEIMNRVSSVTFDQRGQLVSSQINVAGSYVIVGPDTTLVNVLIVSANPIDTSRLRVDQEVRAIDQALRVSKYRDRFQIKTHWAVRVADLQRYLLSYSPNIVHVSAHGSRSGEIVFENDRGESVLVPVPILGQLFAMLTNKVQCVILDACYSEEVAQAIAVNVDCVIGISRVTNDLAATSFASAFYQAIANGKDVSTAFKLGCIQVQLEGIDDEDAFKLLAIKSDPEKIVFVK